MLIGLRIQINAPIPILHICLETQNSLAIRSFLESNHVLPVPSRPVLPLTLNHQPLIVLLTKSHANPQRFAFNPISAPRAINPVADPKAGDQLSSDLNPSYVDLQESKV